MSRFTLKPFLFLTLLITVLFLQNGYSQDKSGKDADLEKVENYREQIRRLIGFLEFSLNTLGSPETSTREKEVIINESYQKAFLTDKVQVEDDLDENREILTYKDVQAYLKDVDFFFREATFNFDVQDIQSLKNDQGMAYFKVTANRNLLAVTVDDQPVNNNKTRYIEINIDEEEQVLKIASIYTTRLNEAQEMMAWWNGMPSEWKDILGSGYSITDSLMLNQVDFLNDTTFLFVHETPEVVSRESYVFIGTDSLLIVKQDTVMLETYDTLMVGKNSGLRMLKEIAKMESLNISAHPHISDLYPVDQMSDLKALDISGTGITDLFAVRNLNKLTSLNLSGTAVSDLAPIRYNSKIRELYLDSTLVRSLEPIQGYEELEVLHFNHTLVDSLQPVGYLGKLKDLRLEYTPVSDLTPLGNLLSIENISISGTQADSLNALQYLMTLKRLYMENTKIVSLVPLGMLENLQLIDADQSQISDLEPLGNLKSLEKVYCDQTPVTRSMANEFMAARPGVLIIYESQALTGWWAGLSLDWQKIFRKYASLDEKPTTEQLHQLTLLSAIDVNGLDNITALAPLSKLTNLREIDATGTLADDLTPLEDLKDLKVLKCSGTRISSLKPLESLTKLELLDFSGTLIDSLNGLETLDHLQTLNIDRTGVGDLKPVINCKELKIIYCDNTKIGKVDIDPFLDINPQCLIIYQTGNLKSWWNSLPQGYKKAFHAHTQLDESPTREQLHVLAALTEINFSGNREIVSLQPLTTLSRLQSLNLANAAIQDISPLANLVRLKKLNLSGNPVEILTPIGNLPLLTDLDISNTAVSELEDITSLATLEYLNCSGTQIKKLDPVASLEKLKKLECYNTNINNLKPLTGLTGLKQLVCYNTKLNAKKVEAFKEVVPGVEVVFY